MSRSSKHVTHESPDLSLLPSQLSEGVGLLLDLDRRDQLDVLADLVRIRREGGFAGIDVVVFLLLYFTWGGRFGLKGFWERVRPFQQRVAAVAGRKKLPSTGSVSRALCAAQSERLRPGQLTVLYDVAGIDALMKHPAVQTYDGQGQGWHVFDLDPTITTLRHRALPEGDDLPESLRRADQMFAVSGYSGRKRGDLQLARTLLQHNGSGAWLGVRASPGNGSRRTELPELLDVVGQVAARVDHPLDRCLVRADGAYGWVPDFHAFRDAGVPFITRLTRPELLRQSDVLERLAEAEWRFVPDSGSGPRRSAADLGLVTVHPGKDTRRPDGSRYEPIEVRVVASRFVSTRDEASRGVLVDGWQVELFAVDLAPEAWPAADAVAAYFGRTAEENRFAQEDRELGLDRIFCYHLPGQELATTVGLMVWNQRIARGFELHTPPAQQPAVQLRTDDDLDPRPLLQSTPDPDSSEETAPPQVQRKVDDHAEHALVSALDALDWQTLLRKRVGWTWQPERGGLRCPEDQPLSLTCVQQDKKYPSRARLLFRATGPTCMSCSARSTCIHSINPALSKLVSFSVASETAQPIAELLAEARSARRLARSTRAEHRTTRRDLAGKVLPPGTTQIRPAPTTGHPPRRRIAPALFLPAEARRLFEAQFYIAHVRVQLHDAPDGPPQPKLVAPSQRRRQHCRRTWAEHHGRYALDEATQVVIQLSGPPTLRSLARQPGAASPDAEYQAGS